MHGAEDRKKKTESEQKKHQWNHWVHCDQPRPPFREGPAARCVENGQQRVSEQGRGIKAQPSQPNSNR